MNSLPATKARILIVEDDPGLRDLFTGALREAGYEVIHALAEEYADNPAIAPDLLLLDLDLQSPPSWDTFAAWKARHPSLRTVAVTGVPNRFGVARAVGINALMEKPVEPSLLLLVTASVLDESTKSASSPDTGKRFDFRYLTCADARYWRGLRGRWVRARRSRATAQCD